MTDWLEELRQEKQQAIERTRAHGADANPGATGRLESEQQQLAVLIRNVGIEPLLQQFVDEVLRDHPLFVNPTLNRTVTSRDAATSLAREEKEGAPWSGPVAGNFLPAALELPGGRVVTRVDWRLHLSHRTQYSSQLLLNDLLVSASTQGVQVNSETLAAPSAETFKAALISAFRAITQPTLPPGVRRARRRRRSWYNRLWESIFPASQPARVYIALIIVVMLILVMVISILSARLGILTLN